MPCTWPLPTIILLHRYVRTTRWQSSIKNQTEYYKRKRTSASSAGGSAAPKTTRSGVRSPARTGEKTPSLVPCPKHCGARTNSQGDGPPCTGGTGVRGFSWPAVRRSFYLSNNAVGAVSPPAGQVFYLSLLTVANWGVLAKFPVTRRRPAFRCTCPKPTDRSIPCVDTSLVVVYLYCVGESIK